MSTNSELNNSDLLLNANIDIAHNAVDILADRQVSDIVLLDLTELSAFADYFVIGTVDNIRQARAVIDSIQKNLHRQELVKKFKTSSKNYFMGYMWC